MASITITVQGTGGFALSRTFTTADEHVGAIVGSYIADPSIPSAIGPDNAALPRDAAWAVERWMEDAVGMAASKASQWRRNMALKAAEQADYSIPLEVS